MGGISALRKIQWGAEATPGTAVAATAIWRGRGLLEDQREVVHVDEQIGIALPTNRIYIPKLAAAITLDSVEATFRQLPYLLEMGVEQETPAADGVGTGDVYTYVMPTTAQRTIRHYTIEAGNNQLVQEVEYCFVEKFKLAGNAAQGLMMDAGIIGRQVTDAAFTGSLTVPALVPADHIVFGGAKLYIDAVSGTVGTTEITGTLLGMELDVSTGLRPKFTNLAKYFDFVYFDRGSFSGTLKLIFEHDTNADAQRDLFEAGTPRLIRLRFIGKALGTAGTYSTEILDIDCAGVYTGMPTSSQDGNDTVEATFQIGHDLTASLGLTLRVVVDSYTALP